MSNNMYNGRNQFLNIYEYVHMNRKKALTLENNNTKNVVFVLQIYNFSYINTLF